MRFYPTLNTFSIKTIPHPPQLRWLFDFLFFHSMLNWDRYENEISSLYSIFISIDNTMELTHKNFHNLLITACAFFHICSNQIKLFYLCFFFISSSTASSHLRPIFKLNFFLFIFISFSLKLTQIDTYMAGKWK